MWSIVFEETCTDHVSCLSSLKGSAGAFNIIASQWEFYNREGVPATWEIFTARIECDSLTGRVTKELDVGAAALFLGFREFPPTDFGF